jgi:ABC-2 type transport system ATP-binding protein
VDHPQGSQLKRMTDAQPSVRTEGLTRTFGATTAIDGLDLSIPAGELFGLVGPDGAGKTTTLRLLAGLLSISEGGAWVAGISLKDRPEAVKPLIGYMAQEFSLYAELTVSENLRFFAELYQVPRAQLAERMDRLLGFAGLREFTERRAGDLSGGMQKKLALACTLIHEPPVLLLDEPTTGVDPISRREFWDILTTLHVGGTTILVSTPYMDEADRCTRVGLIYRGRLAVCEPPRRIRARLEGEVIHLRTPDWRTARKFLGGMRGVIEVQTYGEALHLLVDSAERRLPEIRAELDRRGLKIEELRPAPARMEEAFISLIKRMDAERAQAG